MADEILINEKRLIELFNQGLSYHEISKFFNVHRTTITKKLKKLGFEHVKNNGVCVICGNKTDSRRKRCDTCSTKIRRYRAKKASVEYKGGKCEKCGWSGNIACFDFHHKDPTQKDFNPSAVHLANKSWEVVKKELDKCQLLCANCHRLEHNDYENIEFLKIANIESEDLVFKN